MEHKTVPQIIFIFNQSRIASWKERYLMPDDHTVIPYLLEGGMWMKVGFIGAGKVGCSLGKYFVENGITVTGFYSRSLESSKAAADFTQTVNYETMESILEDSDTLFLTVPDGQIGKVWDYMGNLDIKNKVICHCSGSISSATFFMGKKEVQRYIPYIRFMQSAINLNRGKA